MKFYLSSDSLGKEVATLQRLLPAASRIGYIANAQDSTAVSEPSSAFQIKEMEALNRLGFKAEPLDLRTYFGKIDELRERLIQLDGLWVTGGNTFVLRRAMRLSGFDGLFPELRKRASFLYGGSSAGICVLCDSLKYIQQIDDPYYMAYAENPSVIWEGLGVFNHGILPHYRTARAIRKEIKACIANKWLFKALRDGEVIILED